MKVAGKQDQLVDLLIATTVWGQNIRTMNTTAAPIETSADTQRVALLALPLRVVGGDLVLEGSAAAPSTATASARTS